MKNNNILKRIFIKLLNLYYLRVFKYKVQNTKPIELLKNSDVVICMLSGHKNVIESIATLKSFYRFSIQKYTLNFHSDGTLTQDDCSLLKHHFPNINIIQDHEKDEVGVFFKNNNYKLCLKLRNENRVNKKLFDFPFYANGKKIIQLDSDVLFFQKPIEFFNAIESNQVVYNLDRGRAYSYQDNIMESYTGKQMPIDFNGGLVTFNCDAEKLYTFCENFLDTNPISERDWVREQTILAMYLSTFDAKPLHRQYDLAYHYVIDFNQSNFDDVISQHYCAWARNMHKIDFITKVYPYLIEENKVNLHYLSIINGTLKP